MAILKCKMCGADLTPEEGVSILTCAYCGITQTIPKVDDEKKMTLFGRAERLRRQCEFDKAAGVYESIVADFPEEAEAYWGLVLCKYGIEYVDDPATGKKIPTCHRSSFDSIMDDIDLEQALENADSVARKVYRDEAKTIEEIRKGIVSVSANEQPYDIFICYKETAEDGDRTLDSVLAQDIYDALTDKGYRVFFSRITLEDKLGLEYEPYIFAALNSAKIMLAVGTDYEYYNAVWVKNEWSRYLKLMTQDKEKHLIPCYKNIDAYDMPKEFAKLQAQDLGKVGAIQDLLRGIDKLLPKQAVPVVTAAPVSSVNAMVMRGQFALDDGDFVKADEYFDRALDQNPQEGLAYLGKVLAALHMSQPEEITSRVVNLDTFKDYERAIKFSDSTTAAKLTAIREKNNHRFTTKRLISALRKVQDQKQQTAERLERERQQEQERITQERLEEAKRLAEEKQQEAMRQACEKLQAVRDRIRPAQGLLAAGAFHLLGVKTDGTVLATGGIAHQECVVQHWRNIIAVSAGFLHSVGLTSAGTVLATGKGDKDQCNVGAWRNIKAISTGHFHTLALDANGTAWATGNNEKKQCQLDGWNDMIALAAGQSHTLGLKSDGTVVAAGGTAFKEDRVGHWNDIVAVAGSPEMSLGLKADGCVVVAGHPLFGAGEVTSWRDIVAISCGETHTVGLKADGTVVAVGKNDKGQCNVQQWQNIVAIAAGFNYTAALGADGKVLMTGDNHSGKLLPFGWKLFENLDTIEEERAIATKQRQEADQQQQEALRIMAQRRNEGLCLHCGGTFKGLFSKNCTVCGKPKDY